MPKYSAPIAALENGVQKIFHRLHDGDWAYETRQDVEPILDANKEAVNHYNPWSPSRDIKLVARIPPIFIQKWANELGINYYDPNHQEAVDRLLDSPEYRWLRTDNSKLYERKVSKATIENRVAMRKLFAED